MKATAYLLLTSLKNRLLALKKKPVMLIFYIICIACVAGLLIMYSFVEPQETQKFADIRIIYAIVAGFGLLFTYIGIASGLSTGGTLFTMSDVTLLFVAPVSTKRVLIYGLIKQMGSTLVAAVFIFFQIPNLKMNFDISAWTIANLFIIYAVVVFFSQLISMAIYIFSNGNEGRKKLVKGIVYAAAALLAIVIFMEYRSVNNVFTALLNVVDSTAFGFVPIVGWATAFVKAGVEVNILMYLVAIVLFVIVGAAVVIIMTAGTADYYEDVLLSTEVVFNTQQMAKDGQHVGVINTKKMKIKEKDTGIRRGDGANVLFFRHLLEMKRSSKIPFIGMYTVIATVAAGIMAYMDKSVVSGYVVLGMLVYIQFFLVAMGKLSVELIRPYIYLIPQSPFKKLIYASMTSIVKPFIDGIIIFGVMAIIRQGGFVEAFFQMLAYGASGMIFVSFTIICQKFLGGQPSKILSAFIGIGIFIVMIGPGVAASVVAAIFLPEALTCICLLPYILLCVLWALLSFLLCRNLLNHMAK